VPTTEVLTASLLEQLQSARAEGDRLFDVVKRNAVYERPISARHRIIFYIGHLDGFDSIQLCREGLGIESGDREFDDLFQAGIDPDSTHLPCDVPSDWPSLDQVLAYVSRCRKNVDAHLENAPESVVHMALEHRLMHLETLAYMFHGLDYEAKNSPEFIDSADMGPAGENEWRTIAAGKAVLGKSDDEVFGWDNEYQEVHCTVP